MVGCWEGKTQKMGRSEVSAMAWDLGGWGKVLGLGHIGVWLRGEELGVRSPGGAELPEVRNPTSGSSYHLGRVRSGNVV